MREFSKLFGYLAAALWVAQPFTIGPILGAATADAVRSLGLLAAIGGWALWVTILIALLVRLPVTLVVARIGVAANFALSIWLAALSGDASRGGLAVALAGITTGLILAPGVADRFIDGASYGNERRFALRAPGPVLIALVVPAWAIVVAGVCTGPILLASHLWIAGGAATLVGLALAVPAFGSLYSLSKRFIVFVPNGLVIHDRTTLAEPVLLTKKMIVGLGPAKPKDSARAQDPRGPAQAQNNTLDLSASALGLLLAIELRSPINVPCVEGRKKPEKRKASTLLIAPSRPANVMQTALERQIAIA